MKTKILATLEIRFEEVTVVNGPTTLMLSVYTTDNKYVGMLDKNLSHKIAELGIVPELSSSEDNVCSVGKSLKDGKWYGWSHRAIHGFKIGDVVKEGDVCATSGLTDTYIEKYPEEDLSLPVGFEAKTDDDAKRMAIAFADGVS